VFDGIDACPKSGLDTILPFRPARSGCLVCETAAVAMQMLLSTNNLSS
jgi:hypothetical protein